MTNNKKILLAAVVALLGGSGLTLFLLQSLPAVQQPGSSKPVAAAVFDQVDCDSAIDGDAVTDDAADVQAAVLAGGTVCLKGTFDFGTTGSVKITKDVTILGEGADATVIRGGKVVFYTVMPPPDTSLGYGKYFVDIPGPKVAIKGIRFTGSSALAIKLPYASGVNVSGNKFDNLVPVVSINVTCLSNNSYCASPTGPYSVMQGVFLGTYGFTPGSAGITQVVKGAFTGEVVVNNNEFDMTPLAGFTATPLDHTLTMPIRLSGANNLNADFSGNVIRNAIRNGIEILDIVNFDGGSSDVLVSYNEITTGPVGVFNPSLAAPYGIIVGAVQLKTGTGAAVLADPETRYIVTRNELAVLGENFAPDVPQTAVAGYGLVVIANDAIINSNHVTVGGRATNRGIVIQGSRNLIANNKVEGRGQGAFAVSAAPATEWKSNDNLFKANNIDNFSEDSSLTPFAADYQFARVAAGYGDTLSADRTKVTRSFACMGDTSGNTVIGGTGTIVYIRQTMPTSRTWSTIGDKKMPGPLGNRILYRDDGLTTCPSAPYPADFQTVKGEFNVSNTEGGVGDVVSDFMSADQTAEDIAALEAAISAVE